VKNIDQEETKTRVHAFANSKIFSSVRTLNPPVQKVMGRKGRTRKQSFESMDKCFDRGETETCSIKGGKKDRREELEGIKRRDEIMRRIRKRKEEDFLPPPP
jgi:hypothetical protein